MSKKIMSKIVEDEREEHQEVCYKKLHESETQIDCFKIIRLHKNKEGELKSHISENLDKLRPLLVNGDIQIKQALLQFEQVNLKIR